jgi:hypothetical protein
MAMAGFGAARAIVVLIAICAVVGLAGAIYLETGATTSTNSLTHPSNQYPTSTHDNLIPINLNFSLDLNATSLRVGQSIGITISLRNDLDSTNNVTADNGAWATLPEVSLYACSAPEIPYGILVAQGYYASNNISSATPLVVLSEPGIYNCGMVFHIASYLFSPQSTSVSVHASCGTSVCDSFNATSNLRIDGHWASISNSSSPTFEALTPGVYTVAAVTEWGQIDVLHFAVSSS